MSHETNSGKVYLVGAGPGDPDLITVKGRRCITLADIVVYDYLAAKSLLEHAKPQAQCIYVGKKGGNHTLPQMDINQLIVSHAQAGKIVTRLKGGDPFIFGRGGEEAEVLAAAGIPFEIVPGVTSAIAAPAYAGIPLTHRDHTSTVAFVTGHEDPTKGRSDIHWPSLAKGIGTLVFLMGVKNLPHIVDQLLRNGRSARTPIALVQWGTANHQKTVVGSLNDITQKVKEAGISSPAIIVIGEVVKLRRTLQWFENRPLYGKRIVVTRARAQASDLVHKLTELGANCRQCPTIEPVPPEDPTGIDTAIANLSGYDWIIFTSVNGVAFFFERLSQKGGDVRRLGNMQTAAIGPATARALERHGLMADILPETYQAESLAAAFTDVSMKGKKVLLPRALQAREILPKELRRMGALVDEVVAYQTLQSSENASAIAQELGAGEIDMITFTSSSTVTNFFHLFPEGQAQTLTNKASIACIGPITSGTARKLGLHVDVEAEKFTINGLCEAIVNFYKK